MLNPPTPPSPPSMAQVPMVAGPHELYVFMCGDPKCGHEGILIGAMGKQMVLFVAYTLAGARMMLPAAERLARDHGMSFRVRRFVAAGADRGDVTDLVRQSFKRQES